MNGVICIAIYIRWASLVPSQVNENSNDIILSGKSLKSLFPISQLVVYSWEVGSMFLLPVGKQPSIPMIIKLNLLFDRKRTSTIITLMF